MLVPHTNESPLHFETKLHAHAFPSPPRRIPVAEVGLTVNALGVATKTRRTGPRVRTKSWGGSSPQTVVHKMVGEFIINAVANVRNKGQS